MKTSYDIGDGFEGALDLFVVPRRSYISPGKVGQYRSSALCWLNKYPIIALGNANAQQGVFDVDTWITSRPCTAPLTSGASDGTKCRRCREGNVFSRIRNVMIVLNRILVVECRWSNPETS